MIPHFHDHHHLPDQLYWNLLGQSELEVALAMEPNTNVARNVILFVGDGMSLNTITAARMLKGQLSNHTGEEQLLSWERFPYVALSKVTKFNFFLATSKICQTKFMKNHFLQSINYS